MQPNHDPIISEISQILLKMVRRQPEELACGLGPVAAVLFSTQDRKVPGTQAAGPLQDLLHVEVPEAPLCSELPLSMPRPALQLWEGKLFP